MTDQECGSVEIMYHQVGSNPKGGSIMGGLVGDIILLFYGRVGRRGSRVHQGVSEARKRTRHPIKIPPAVAFCRCAAVSTASTRNVGESSLIVKEFLRHL